MLRLLGLPAMGALAAAPLASAWAQSPAAKPPPAVSGYAEPPLEKVEEKKDESVAEEPWDKASEAYPYSGHIVEQNSAAPASGGGRGRTHCRGAASWSGRSAG